MAARKPQAVSKLPFVITESVGLALAGYLFLVSTQLIGNGKLPCGRSKWFACESAVQGPMSYIGPFSFAAMGILYFLLHLALTLGMRDRLAQWGKVLLVGGGIFFIAWLRSLEFLYLHKICPWCWGVALVTLINAGFTWPLAYPVLPRLRPLQIAGAIAGGFILLVGVVTLLEGGLKVGAWMQRQPRKGSAATAPSADVTPTTTPAPAKTPAPTPKPTPAPAATTGAQATPTPAPTPRLDPEPELADSEDVRVLRARGWRHAPSGEAVVRAVKVAPPVLMLAYDPYCNDCHHLITKVLNNDVMNSIPVTRLAIQESMLSGQVDKMVKEMPTLILFGKGGNVLMEHVGSRISPQELADKIRQSLQ